MCIVPFESELHNHNKVIIYVNIYPLNYGVSIADNIDSVRKQTEDYSSING